MSTFGASIILKKTIIKIRNVPNTTSIKIIYLKAEKRDFLIDQIQYLQAVSFRIIQTYVKSMTSN